MEVKTIRSRLERGAEHQMLSSPAGIDLQVENVKLVSFLTPYRQTNLYDFSCGKRSLTGLAYFLGLSGLQQGQYFAVLCVFFSLRSSRFVPAKMTTKA